MRYTREERLELFQEAKKNILLGLEMLYKAKKDGGYLEPKVWLVWVEEDGLDKLGGDYTQVELLLDGMIGQEEYFIKQDKLNRIKKNGK